MATEKINNQDIEIHQSMAVNQKRELVIQTMECVTREYLEALKESKNLYKITKRNPTV